MKTATAALATALLLCSACAEPPKIGQMEELVTSLAHLHGWDPIMQGKGHYAYDAVMGYGPEIYPILVAHLTDETPTAVYDDISRRNPKISDVAFLMLLELTKRKWQDFAEDGVFVSTALSNPVFCIKWDRPTKFKTQAHFSRIIDKQ
jgi:hypothetical protein